MPCSKFGHRGFKHGQGHGRGQSCKQRCMLGAMTIPELLNFSNVCRAIPPRYNNCKFRRSGNCGTYRRECTSSYSDDEPERLETPNNACENDYKCADTQVLVRECIYPPCQTPPLFEWPISCPYRFPCVKPPPCKPSPALISTCSNTCDDSYMEIPYPNPDPAGQYFSDSLCKKPSLYQRLPISCPDPTVCKAPPSAQIPSTCTTTPLSESLSIVICDPDEDKVGRRVSFGSVSEQKITPCLRKDPRALDPVCIIEMPMCAVASTQVCPKPTQSCATQNDLNYVSSVESQSNLCDCKKGSTASLEMHSQTYSESSITCGVKGCPKSTTAKCKCSNNSSKGKKQKENKELNSCDAVDCPKSTSIIHDCPPCVSPSSSKKRLKCPKCKNNFKNKEHSLSVSKSPPLTPSASDEIRSESLCSNKSEALCTCTYNNEEESQSKCDIHKNSDKKSWFRKSKGKTTRKEQQKPIGNSKQKKENTKTVSTATAHGEQCKQITKCKHLNPEAQHSQHTKVTLNDQEISRGFASNGQLVQGESKIKTQDLLQNGTEQCMREHMPQGQNVHSQLVQGAQSSHGQLFPDRQSLQEQIQIPRDQFTSGVQTSPELTSRGMQTSTSHFDQREQMPQSQVVSGIQTQPGPLPQSAQTFLRNSCTCPEGQLPLRQFALEKQMPPNQFVSEIQTPRRLSSQSSKVSQSQFYSQDQFKRQQNPQSEFISVGQMPRNQFASGGQTAGGYFTPTRQTPQGEFPGGQYPRDQFTPDGQNLLGQSSPGQVASGEKYPKNQLAQSPQNEFVPSGHIPQSPYIPGGQNLQGQFAPGRIPEGGSAAGEHVPQSQFTPDGHYNQGFPQNQYTTNDQTVTSHFIPDRKFGESMPIFPKEQIVPGQFALGGQNTQLPSTGQIAQSHFGGTAPQSLFNTKPFNNDGGPLPYSSPDTFSPVKKPLHLQEQGQYHLERPGPFATRGSIPPIQSVSGGQILSRQAPPGGQMTPSQLVSELPYDQITSDDSNRQKLASEVGTPPDQFVLGSLDQTGMIDKPRLLGQIPPTEMFQHLQDQVQSPRELGLIASGSPISPGQSNTGSQKPPRHVSLEGQMLPRQPISAGPTPTATLLLGGQLPSNQYTPMELPQNQISSELLNKQQLASQVGTPPDQLDLRNLNKTDLGATRDQNWHGIICPLCGFEGRLDQTVDTGTPPNQVVLQCLDKKDTIILTPCSNANTHIDIACSCSILDGRDKITCTNKKSSKNCQDACVQCKGTWYVQNLIVNTSINEFQHPNNVLAVETPDNISDNPKSNACCECHYPPMFRHFQCSGNMCGICTCGETE